jgi:hypothetical protein
MMSSTVDEILANMSPELRAFRDECIRKGEEEFERLVAPFPYRVMIDRLFSYENDYGGIDEDFHTDLARMQNWLKDNMEDGTYCPFPLEATGIHMKECAAVYFLHLGDAIKFKLIWS